MTILRPALHLVFVSILSSLLGCSTTPTASDGSADASTKSKGANIESGTTLNETVRGTLTAP
jgi:hypothetical protein